MSMTQADAKAAVKTALLSSFSPSFLPNTDAAKIQQAIDALAGAISELIPYIQAHAEVPSGIAVSTTGGPGSTTAPGQVQ